MKRPALVAPKDAKWYATPYPYLGLYIAVMLALFVFGKENPGLKLGSFGMAVLYYVGIRITVLVAAFKDAVMKGVMCLICDIYAIYWVYSESESTFLKIAYSVIVILALALKFARLAD